jgi:heme-degrading monooxygenase HmoA
MQKITRVWHGITQAQHAEVYQKYIEDTGMREYKAVKGNLSAKLWKRIEGDRCHFFTVTEWDSYESIIQFAGKDFAKAKYYPDDKKYLLEFEENVSHFETFEY